MVVMIGCAERGAPTPEPVGETTAEDRVAVSIYGSDNCTSGLVAVVSSTTDCTTLGGTSAWGVRVGGRCFDISDTNATTACNRFKGAATSEAIGIFNSDNCSSSALAFVNETTDCASVGAGLSSAWGVMINGVCNDISDAPFVSTCERFKSQVPGGVELFNSDNCSSGLLASIGERTDCDRLASTTSSSVWGVRFGGVCHDVPDTSAKRACEAFKAAASPAGVKLYNSDNCSSSLAGVVNSTTNCASFAANVSSNIWGISIDGECSDISDTNALTACNRFGGAGGGGGGGGGPTGVAVFDNDACSGTPIASLVPTSDCSALATTVSASVRAVRIAGACANIRDTTVVDACTRYRDVDP